MQRVVKPLFCFIMDKSVEDRIRSLAGRVADDHGYEVFGITLLGRGRRTFLRVAIDKEGGVTLDDCETFSRGLEALLDVEDPIAGSYTLEVSSPGLDRPLKDVSDFTKNVGRLVRIVTKEDIDNQSFFLGRLEEVEGDVIRLSLSGGSKGEVSIPFSNVSKARLEVELK